VVIRKTDGPLAWQSKTVLLLVVPWTVASVILQGHWWFLQVPVVAWTTLGISAIFGLVAWRLRAGTPAAAATGAAICASLMFSTVRYPYESSWRHGGLLPLLTVFLLIFAATRMGRSRKEKRGLAESRRGRGANQAAANLGMAALLASLAPILGWDTQANPLTLGAMLAIAALAEAAADTVSSEFGQAFGGQPRLVFTLRRVAPGTDGGVTLAGTAAGIIAAAIVAAVGSWALGGGLLDAAFCTAGGVIGLFFDSVLGATLERKGWLSNDAVNFLSTLSAPIASLAGVWLSAVILMHH